MIYHRTNMGNIVEDEINSLKISLNGQVKGPRIDVYREADANERT